MNRGGKYRGLKFRENRVGFYVVSVLVLGIISDKAARRNCISKQIIQSIHSIIMDKWREIIVVSMGFSLSFGSISV